MTANMWFSRNQISSTLPTEVGKLQKMNSMLVGWYNVMGGPLPTEMGRLTNLSELWYGNNAFSSSIPTELGALTTITENLQLDNNALTSAIPTELGKLTVESGASGGTSFYLYSNKLCDELPSELAVTAQTFHESIYEGNSIGTLCGSELSDDGAAYNDDEAIKGKSKN